MKDDVINPYNATTVHKEIIEREREPWMEFEFLVQVQVDVLIG